MADVIGEQLYGTIPPTSEGAMKTEIGVNLTEVAKACHEANREYCQSIGDDSQPTWEDAPDWQKESAIAGVQAIYDGRVTRPEQSHEGWLAQKEADGWKYGPVKDPEAKEHPCFVPYNELPESQRKKDDIFLATVAASLGFAVIRDEDGHVVRLDSHPMPSLPIEHPTEDDGLGIASIAPEHIREDEAPALDGVAPVGNDEANAPDHPFPEMAASDIPAPVEIPEPLDDTDEPQGDETGVEREEIFISAKQLAEHIEAAPAHITLPEGSLPPGTEIVVEQKGHFIFKLPGQPMHNGRGRTIYGAMLNAGILK